MVTIPASDHEATVAVNEALLLGALRQHQLREQSDDAKTVLLIEVNDRKQAQLALLESEQKLQLMADALREANRLLSDRAMLLETLVQERTATLRQTVAELEAFSYSIAHDLRAPLRSMSSFADILLREHARELNVDGHHFLRRIVRSAGLMDQLIRDVLNYGQVLRAPLASELVDVETLFVELMDTYPTFHRANANIAMEVPFPSVLGNAAMLMQVFTHLLENAVKFGRPGEKPRIKVWSESTPTHVTFYVRDNGIGIPAGQKERIFGLFEQLDQRCDGTGIGLAIVKKAVDRMGGKVGVDSELGHGSTFWVELRSSGQ